MPLLDENEARYLLGYAAAGVAQSCCEQTLAKDYCRTCDEFYFLHAPGCPRREDKHHGHRLTIIPFVEMR